MNEILPYSLGIKFETIDPLKRRGNLVLITDGLADEFSQKKYIDACALACQTCTNQFICTSFTSEGTAFVMVDGNVRAGLVKIGTPCSTYILVPTEGK